MPFWRGYIDDLIGRSGVLVEEARIKEALKDDGGVLLGVTGTMLVPLEKNVCMYET